MEAKLNVFSGPYLGKNDISSSSEESTHTSLIFLMKLANCLGILPVSGLTSSPSDLHFSWRSWKCIYSLTVIAIFLFNTVLCFIHWSIAKFNFNLLATQMYYVNAVTAVSLYIHLAQRWPKFINKWHKIDKSMNPVYGFPKNLDRRIKIAAAVILSATIGEYVLWVPYKVSKFSTEEGRIPQGRDYYEFAFPEFSVSIPFNAFIFGYASISGLLSSLIWSFNDLFIISISSALALRFRQITDRLALDEKKANSNDYWIEVRGDYDKLVHLSKKVDKKISYVVLLSFSANIFFLLIQLSNTVGNMTYDFEIIYYLYSFALLISRLTAVSLYAAWVNDESKEPANVLNSVPSATYNTEIRRLLLQISFDDVAITGSKMFKVTRGLILSVAGAIVTYELVVIQFNHSFMESEKLDE